MNEHEEMIVDTQEQEQNDPIQDMKAEIEQLKAERKSAQLLEHMRKQLSARGLEVEFAELIVGQSEQESQKRLEDFEARYKKAVGRGVKSYLPGTTPDDFDVKNATPRKHRGIRRITK